MNEGRFHLTMAASALLVVGVSLYGLHATRIVLSLPQLAPRTVLLGLLLGGAAFYRWRKEERALNLIMMAFWAVLFSNLHLLPMFIAARQRVALSDALLARVDAALGIEVPDVLRVMQAFPALRSLLESAYGTLLPLLVLAILLPPVCGKKAKAKEFALSCVVAAWIGLPLFAIFQAVGPWVHYHYLPAINQERYTEVFFALKAEKTFVLDLSYNDGLISFPSFHTILAFLAAVALWSIPYVRWPGALVALSIIVSTVTTGTHYLADVLAGLVVALLSLGAARGYLWLEGRTSRLAVGRPRTRAGRFDVACPDHHSSQAAQVPALTP